MCVVLKGKSFLVNLKLWLQTFCLCKKCQVYFSNANPEELRDYMLYLAQVASIIHFLSIFMNLRQIITISEENGSEIW